LSKDIGSDIGEAIAGIIIGISGGIAAGAILDYLFGQKCPYCKKSISKDMVQCPHCGNFLGRGLTR